ncbi:hypothetical protein PVK06_046488 [Gossypium arboreum]|uniref:Uncharacterized protein n=1 Tax=Gossypium arboreum TaxID=29729 RepID=A0ABR0MAW7_GOSAR|nr:hypothetical protein PVK06_046488 [Gossypium arboreum]
MRDEPCWDWGTLVLDIYDIALDCRKELALEHACTKTLLVVEFLQFHPEFVGLFAIWREFTTTGDELVLETWLDAAGCESWPPQDGAGCDLLFLTPALLGPLPPSAIQCIGHHTHKPGQVLERKLACVGEVTFLIAEPNGNEMADTLATAGMSKPEGIMGSLWVFFVVI